MKICVALYPLSLIIWIIICVFIWNKIFNLYFFTTLVIFLSTLIFLFTSEPKDFGDWNLLPKTGKGKKNIIISPFSYSYINLVDKEYRLKDTKLMDSICNSLSNCYFIISNHPKIFKETSLSINYEDVNYNFKVKFTSNQGVLIEPEDGGTYQNNKLGDLLMHLDKEQ